MGIALSPLSCVPDQPIDPTKPAVNHDRSGLWAPDPLDEFSSERPASIRPATRLPGPNKRVRVRPAARLLEAHRGTLALVDPAHAASTSKDRLWTFASGSAFGALVCVILVWWLTTSEQPRAEPFVRAPESVPAPVSPVESEMSSVAERTFTVASAQADPPVVEKTRSTPDTKKGSFVGSLRIDSTPQGARVFIDRQAAGVTPLVVSDLVAGSHAIRIEADGYLPWTSAIRVIADRRTRVNTTLALLDSASVRR